MICVQFVLLWYFFGPWRSLIFVAILLNTRNCVLTHAIGLRPDADVICSRDATDSLRHADNTNIIQYMVRNTQTNIRPSARFRRCLEPPAITGDLSPLRLSWERAQPESSQLCRHRKTHEEFSTRHIGLKKRRNPAVDSEECESWSCKEPSVGKSQGEPIV